MVDASPANLSVLMYAYHAGMRRGEILGLTWERVDIKAGFIRLRESDAKTGEGRNIPIGRELGEML
jgi:integrase